MNKFNENKQRKLDNLKGKIWEQLITFQLSKEEEGYLLDLLTGIALEENYDEVREFIRITMPIR